MASNNKKFSKQQQLSLALNFGEDDKINDKSLEFISRLNIIKPTIVFDTYWYFATERQNIFFKKFQGEPIPWTNDPILEKYKFTNAYRASDRTSQYLIRNVIYRYDLPSTPEEVFFRIMLFKFFNKIGTWELIENEIGYITWSDYSFKQYDRILTEAMQQGETIYSAAYMMPSGSEYKVKHRNHLKLIEQMLQDELPKKLQDASTMSEGFKLLRQYPTMGNFLAYQFITDINYSEITNWTEMEFVVPGPGATDGIYKCFSDLGNWNESDVIKLVAESQDEEFERLGLEFPSLWGRKLQLIDCQNLFCEVDKYARLKHPKFYGKSGRTRIKQKYRSVQSKIYYWYPPKWGINELIQASKKKLCYI